MLAIFSPDMRRAALSAKTQAALSRVPHAVQNGRTGSIMTQPVLADTLTDKDRRTLEELSERWHREALDLLRGAARIRAMAGLLPTTLPPEVSSLDDYRVPRQAVQR